MEVEKVGSIVKYILLDLVGLQVLVGSRFCIWVDMSERVTNDNRYADLLTSVRELPHSLGLRFLNTLFPGLFLRGLIMLSFVIIAFIETFPDLSPEPVKKQCALPS